LGVEPALKCGLPQLAMSNHLERNILNRGLDFLEKSYVSQLGIFRIHYSTTDENHSVDASELIDGIPKYVFEAGIAADSAYHILIDEMGFLPPVPDNGIDGDELDIYIKNWGGTVYAYTYFDDAGSPTYLVIDNDFAEPGYTTHGLDAMRVTVAHEFFHMVQLRLSAPLGSLNGNTFWFEMSSVWFEDACYPEVNDYLAYTPYVLTNPSPALDGFGIAMYGHGLFCKVLDKELGWNGDTHIVKDIWSHLSANDALDVINQRLESNLWNSSLENQMGHYSLYNFFVGSRSKAQEYYEDANLMTAFEIQETEIVQPFPFSINLMIPPLQNIYRAYRPLEYGQHYVSLNHDTPDNFKGWILQEDPFSNMEITDQLTHDYTSFGDIGNEHIVYFALSNAQSDATLDISFSFEGETIPLKDALISSFPNPLYINSNILSLKVMVDASGNFPLTLYNINGQEILWEYRQISEGIHFIDIEFPTHLSSGVYFVKLNLYTASIVHRIIWIK
jgi:hypothetical protein